MRLSRPLAVLYLVVSIVQTALFLARSNAVFQHANLGDLHLHSITGLHKRARGRSHARDRARADQITGFERDNRRDIFDDLVDRVQHLSRVVVCLRSPLI